MSNQDFFQITRTTMSRCAPSWVFRVSFLAILAFAPSAVSAAQEGDAEALYAIPASELAAQQRSLTRFDAHVTRRGKRALKRLASRGLSKNTPSAAGMGGKIRVSDPFSPEEIEDGERNLGGYATFLNKNMRGLAKFRRTSN